MRKFAILVSLVLVTFLLSSCAFLERLSEERARALGGAQGTPVDEAAMEEAVAVLEGYKNIVSVSGVLSPEQRSNAKRLCEDVGQWPALVSEAEAQARVDFEYSARLAARSDADYRAARAAATAAAGDARRAAEYADRTSAAFRAADRANKAGNATQVADAARDAARNARAAAAALRDAVGRDIRNNDPTAGRYLDALARRAERNADSGDSAAAVQAAFDAAQAAHKAAKYAARVAARVAARIAGDDEYRRRNRANAQAKAEASANTAQNMRNLANRARDLCSYLKREAGINALDDLDPIYPRPPYGFDQEPLPGGGTTGDTGTPGDGSTDIFLPPANPPPTGGG